MADVQRLLMRVMGRLNIRIYRASGGRVMGKVRGVPVLLLTVAGRRTGAEHTTPVSYIEDGGRFIVTGSAGGTPSIRSGFGTCDARTGRLSRLGAGASTSRWPSPDLTSTGSCGSSCSPGHPSLPTTRRRLSGRSRWLFLADSLRPPEEREAKSTLVRHQRRLVHPLP